MKDFDAHPDDEEELREELDYSIMKHDLEYADTFRATPEDIGPEVHYEKSSCCGCFEIKHTCKSGRVYFLGCNYGH